MDFYEEGENSNGVPDEKLPAAENNHYEIAVDQEENNGYTWSKLKSRKLVWKGRQYENRYTSRTDHGSHRDGSRIDETNVILQLRRSSEFLPTYTH